MKDFIKLIVKEEAGNDENLNRIREYIQAYFLYISYRKKYYNNIVFTGGTALRFIHGTRRFSEDLDFSLSSRSRDYDFILMMKDIEREFKLAGYSVEIKSKIKNTVHSAQLRFPEILFETGLSSFKDEKLMVKVEIDSNPPQGGIEAHTLYNSTFMFYMVHYDLSSLFAGKMHALFCRKYTKGRDWYDLFWYLSKFKGLEPNFTMLNNAMAQTEKKPLILGPDNWREELRKIITNLDFSQVRNDVSRFLERSEEAEFLELKAFERLLR